MDDIIELKVPVAGNLRRPRWLYRLIAWVLGTFWMPCPRCGREWSGFEWGLDDYPAPITVDQGKNWRHGAGVCTVCMREQVQRDAYMLFLDDIAKEMNLATGS